MKTKIVKDEYLHICEFEKKLSPNTVRAYSTALRDFLSFLESHGNRRYQQKGNPRLHPEAQYNP